MNSQAEQKTTPHCNARDLKALYAQNFALVTPASKDAEGEKLLAPLKKEEEDVSSPTANIDQSTITLSSSTEILLNTSPVSQITHMDTQENTLDNIDPLPYNQHEHIALHGCLGNHFLDFNDSAAQESVSNFNEIYNGSMYFGPEEKQLPNLPGGDAMSAASNLPHTLYHPSLPNPPPPLHFPMFQEVHPHPQYVYCNYGYSHFEEHPTNSTTILHPKTLAKQSCVPSAHRSGETADNVNFIREATDYDVVCGRGGRINSHPGNRRFREFINELKYQYLNEPKQTKPMIAMRVLDLVKQSIPPGRFLMKFNEGYLECSEDRAKEKASQALREGAAKLRKEGYGNAKKDAGPLVVKPILLSSERASKSRSGYADEEKYRDKFDPPRPKKKTKRASV